MEGGRIVVPAGTYYIKGPIVLQSNVCIELQKGATLKFAPEEKYYPMVSTSWEGTFLYNYSPLIYGYGLHDVAIVGEGTIDGNAMTTFATWKPNQKKAQQLSRKMNHEEVPVEQRKFGDGCWLRPQLVQLYNCRGITLEGVKITNSPFWCIHLLKSENIICRNLRYDAQAHQQRWHRPRMLAQHPYRGRVLRQWRRQRGHQERSRQRWMERPFSLGEHHHPQLPFQGLARRGHR